MVSNRKRSIASDLIMPGSKTEAISFLELKYIYLELEINTLCNVAIYQPVTIAT